MKNSDRFSFSGSLLVRTLPNVASQHPLLLVFYHALKERKGYHQGIQVEMLLLVIPKSLSLHWFYVPRQLPSLKGPNAFWKCHEHFDKLLPPVIFFSYLMRLLYGLIFSIGYVTCVLPCVYVSKCEVDM